MKRQLLLCIAMVAILVCACAIATGAEQAPPQDSVLAHVTSDGITTYFTNYQDGVAYANEQGGTLKMLKDRPENILTEMIYFVGQDVTLDLNGKAAVNFMISVRDSTVTVIDSSETKTGVLNTGAYTCSADSLGTLIFDGVRLNGTTINSSYLGSVEIRGTELDTCTVLETGGNVLFDDVKVVGNGLTVELDSPRSQTVKLRSAEIESTLTVRKYESKSFYTPVSLILDEGYAFYEDGALAFAGFHQISGVTVGAGHIHDPNSLKSVPYDHGHTYGCGCGVIIAEEPVVSDHCFVDGEHKCVECELYFAAVVTYGDTTCHALNIEQALDQLSTVEQDAKITLTKDFYDFYMIANYDRPYTLTIDLNGYELGISFFYVPNSGSTVIIEDTSEQQTGALVAEQLNYSILAGAGTFILESGNIFGIVELFGDEENRGTFVMNGGTIRALIGVILYDYADVIINNGRMEVSRLFEAYYEKDQAKIQIYGCVFPNGIDVSEFSGKVIGDWFPSVGECELGLYDINGEKLDSNTNLYEGYCFVGHSKGSITGDQATHTGACEVCDVIYLVEPHTTGALVQNANDPNKHGFICTTCSYVLESEPHTGGTPSCTKQAVCELCEASYGALADHQYDDDYDADCNTCGETRDAETPTEPPEQERSTAEDESGSTTEDTQGTTVEDTQGTTVEDTQGTTVEDTQGTTVEDTQGTTVEDTQNDPGKTGAGTIVLVCVVAVVALGCGAIGIYWFAIKKKK